MVRLEIAVTSAGGALTARAAGADRVELGTALELGGLTPSQGQAAAVLEAVGSGRGAHDGAGFGVHALIRPRPGDFVYDDDQARAAVREVTELVRLGVHGVVVGALTPAGTVDVGHLRALVDAAKSENDRVQITFHRAIDQAADAMACLDSLRGSGVSRILTSGQAARAIDGAGTLRRLAAAGAGEFEIMAGGGVRPQDIAALRETGIAAVHLSAKRLFSRGSSRVALGAGDTADPDAYFVTDAETVAAAARETRAV